MIESLTALMQCCNSSSWPLLDQSDILLIQRLLHSFTDTKTSRTLFKNDSKSPKFSNWTFFTNCCTVRSDLEIDQIAKIVQNWSKPTSGYMIRFQKNGFSFLVIFAQKSPFSQNRSDRPRFKNGLIFTFLLVKLSDWK